MAGKVDKIKKLLNKANSSGVTSEEAETYRQAAMRMMADEMITEDMLKDDAPKREVIFHRFFFQPEHAKGKANLMSYIAIGMGLRAVFPTNEYPERNVVDIFGWQEDIERADWLFDILLLDIFDQMKAYSPYHYKQVKWRNAFFLSYAKAVYIRLLAAVKDSVKESGNSGKAEIVLADKKSMIDNAVARKYGQLGTMKRTVSSQAGSAAGFVAGSKANLHNVTSMSHVGTTAIGS